jgi:N-acetylglucosamine kinase-like BadF-type ATPase
MSVYVGLDCGGSSTRVLAMDGEGNVLYKGQSGAANLASTPESRIRRHLANAVRNCPPADYVCGCFAGLISEELERHGLAILADCFPGAQLRAEPDYLAVYYAAPANTDVCVIAGTGSLVFSVCDGKILKRGGRGYILGDQGSGFVYGRDAVNHFLDDPSSASPALCQAIADQFGTCEPGELVASLYRAATPAAMLSKIVKAVGTDARRDEPYALASIEQNTASLAKVACKHIASAHPEQSSLNICLAGGVWKAAPNFSQRFTNHLESMLTGRNLNVYRVLRPPLYGAVELAKQIEYGN